MKTTTKTRDEYFAQAGEREPDLRNLDELIRKTAPELQPFLLSSTMGFLGYGPYHYKYASGREGDWAVVSVANQKNYMSLYICIAKEGKYLPEIYNDRLGKVSIGKSCIRFKKFDDLNLAGLKKFLKPHKNWLRINPISRCK